MRAISVDYYSGCACPLTMVCNQHEIGRATAFFWRSGGRTHLVSNWHVFSGREPISGQPKDQKYGAVPDTLQVRGVTKDNPNEPFSVTVPLTDHKGMSLWWQHKTFGQRADLAVLELDRTLGNADQLGRIPCLNEVPQVTNMITRVGQDVFVLGFPLGIMKTGTFPIWKRASIATEFDFPINDMPCFLIDTATREGMSGAPVIQRTDAYHQQGGGQILAGPIVTQILGIYSGRYVGELGEAQLGIVWKRELIEDIFRDPAPGDYVLA